MGVDISIKQRRTTIKEAKKGGRKDVKGDNPYLKLLVKLYKFLSRRTASNFNKVVAKRLCQTRKMKAPLSLSKLKLHMEKKADKTAVIVGTVTNDPRLLECPEGLKVCALRFTEIARKRIEKAGGSCMTFDELAMKSPLGKGCVLLRGPVHARTVEKYFGAAPGVPGSTTRPYVRKATNLKRKGRKFEQARGRRKSRGYKC
jgi:large subunit ribosomal protein L18e